MNKTFLLFSLALPLLVLSCAKEELNAPADAELETRTPQCTPERFTFDDVWESDFPSWYMPCVEEALDMHFTAHWKSKTIVSASCNVHDRGDQVWEITAVGLESGHTYYMYGTDKWRSHYGIWDANHQRAEIYNAASTLNIINQTTGETWENMEYHYNALLNANGEVVIYEFEFFDCE